MRLLPPASRWRPRRLSPPSKSTQAGTRAWRGASDLCTALKLMALFPVPSCATACSTSCAPRRFPPYPPQLSRPSSFPPSQPRLAGPHPLFRPPPVRRPPAGPGLLHSPRCRSVAGVTLAKTLSSARGASPAACLVPNRKIVDHSSSNGHPPCVPAARSPRRISTRKRASRSRNPTPRMESTTMHSTPSMR
ncbi:hypothetical protein B0H11DRAFT_477736 [Mycena galericulata]|nr:hypothetical protein B0H11DRAFT_477736 [Mycena galericulata]